jgi:medium-chain acyl-[acyl-carrier-protein] hydrolase
MSRADNPERSSHTNLCEPSAVISVPRKDARLRLVCLPYAGGSTAAFARWPALLPEEIELVAVELPGHGRLLRRPLCTDMRTMADSLVRMLCAFRDKPYVLYGHSLGGLLAFVTCWTLERREQVAPAHLIISACRPPHVPSGLQTICSLPEEAFAEHLAQRRSIPESLLHNASYMRVLSPIIRADFELIARYDHPPEARSQCSATICIGVEDNIAPVCDVERWSELFSGETRLHYFEGHHFFIDQRVDDVLATITTACLETLE